MLSCHDNFEANFDNYPSMLSYHQALSMASSWRRCKVKDLHVEPLDPTSPLYGHPAAFAAGTSEDAIKDTAANLGLALNVDGNIYPVRGTAYKTLTERAKINGTALPKLSRKDLANVLNACLSVHNSDALLLIRNEKVSAVHSGDETDYSVLPMDELLVTLEKKLGERFPGFVFESGYTDHAYTCGSWILPNQKEGILGAYAKALAAHGQAAMANRLVPGIRFMTSDTGVASAKVSALLIGAQQPIHIGDCIGVDHRNQRKIADFDAEMDKEDMIFERLDEWIWSLEHDVPPTMSGVKPTLAMESLARIYGASKPGLPTIELPYKFERQLRQIANLQAKVKECEDEKKLYEKEIEAHSVRIAEVMKEHEHGILTTTRDKLLIDFVTRTTKRPSSDALKKKYPGVYADVLNVSTSRKVKVSVQPI